MYESVSKINGTPRSLSITESDIKLEHSLDITCHGTSGEREVTLKMINKVPTRIFSNLHY